MKANAIPNGALTALITPFTERGDIDWKGFLQLIEFQAHEGISGIVPVGTTGESPTLNEHEHDFVNSRTIDAKSGLFILNGCGSNCTEEALHYVERVSGFGGQAVLLVDSYYNGPSSLELRREYYAPIAKEFPDILIVPYIIPGRTGCKLLPEDLGALSREFPNICTVKEATGDLGNMRAIRRMTSPSFQIFSGDDDKTLGMMTDPNVKACGVISVISNIAPFAVQKMCQAVFSGNLSGADETKAKLDPLFKVVTVLADRGQHGLSIIDKFRNPLPIKTMMNGLGMPAGPCRQPLGKMSLLGVRMVHDALSSVWKDSPEVLLPIEEFFNVNIGARLADEEIWRALAY